MLAWAWTRIQTFGKAGSGRVPEETSVRDLSRPRLFCTLMSSPIKPPTRLFIPRAN